MLKVAVKRRKRISFIILLILCIISVIPLLWALGTSFKANALTDPLSIIPTEFTLNNYIKLFQQENLPVFRWMFNSLYIAVIKTVLYLIIASLAAYAFGCCQWKGRDVIFWILLSTAMIPSVITIVPLYQFIRNIGLNQTHIALILPGLGDVFMMFLMRQFFMAVPKELNEAAKLEGLNNFGVFVRITIPLSRSAFIVAGLMTFINSWNDYLWPSIVLAGADTEMMTLPVGIANLLGDNNTDYGLTMAAAVISMLPTFIVYLFLQDKIIEGVALTGSKE